MRLLLSVCFSLLFLTTVKGQFVNLDSFARITAKKHLDYNVDSIKVAYHGPNNLFPGEAHSKGDNEPWAEPIGAYIILEGKLKYFRVLSCEILVSSKRKGTRFCFFNYYNDMDLNKLLMEDWTNQEIKTDFSLANVYVKDYETNDVIKPRGLYNFVTGEKKKPITKRDQTILNK